MNIIRFEDWWDNTVVFSTVTHCLEVRQQDTSIYNYCSKFKTKKALFIDLALKGGKLEFEDGITLEANTSNLDGQKTIAIKRSISYNDNWLLDRGFKLWDYDSNSEIYMKDYMYITKVYRKPSTLVLSIHLCTDRSKPMYDLHNSDHKGEITFEVLLYNC